MLHPEDTIQRWFAMERAEHEYRRWAAFFYPMIDQPEQSRLLCDVGMSVVSREIQAGAEARAVVERILRPPLNR